MEKPFKFNLVLLFCATIVGCGIRVVETTNQKSQFDFYKDYVLVKTIQRSFDDDPIFKKDISMSIYSEWTDYVSTTSHGKKLDSLVGVLAQSIKPSPVEDYEGAKPIFQKSLDYYNSKAFDKEIRKILRTPKVPL